MKVALIGYGKMGKIVEAVAKERQVQVVARLGSKDGTITERMLNGAEVCIDFSHPDAVLATIGALCKLGKDMVIGTTGWSSHLDAVSALVEASEVGAIYSPNFSIGMQAFLRLVREAAHIVNRVGGYDAAGFEVHHRGKADSPSGTGIRLAQILCAEMDGKEEPVYDRIHREILPSELHYASIRVGQDPGHHTVIFDSSADTIELSHRARSREGFAVGALLAAEWIRGKKGLFTMDALIDSYLEGS
jgi:4-hydroxy-tetrahydrodipicolinate reductase